MKVNPYISGAGAAAFIGARLVEDVGRMVEEEDLAEVRYWMGAGRLLKV